jgi:hypothetical protein
MRGGAKFSPFLFIHLPVISFIMRLLAFNEPRTMKDKTKTTRMLLFLMNVECCSYIGKMGLKVARAEM